MLEPVNYAQICFITEDSAIEKSQVIAESGSDYNLTEVIVNTLKYSIHNIQKVRERVRIQFPKLFDTSE